MARLALLGPLLTGVGTAVSVVGTIASGRMAAAAERRQAEAQAQQDERQALEERAVSQRQAFEYGRQKRLALSRAQAVAASSGLGATDASVLDLEGDTAAYGTYQEQMAQYGGEARAAALRDDAAYARQSGKIAARSTGIATGFNALSTLIGGATSMYDKYGSVFARTSQRQPAYRGAYG